MKHLKLKSQHERQWIINICHFEKLCLFCVDGRLNTVKTFTSITICDIIHSILGEQSSLILGVTEPTIIMYTYLHNFAKGMVDLGGDLFLAWVGW